MENIYYVYAYLDPRKPGKYIYGEYEFDYEPFYIGKGKGDRFKKHILEAKRNSPLPKNQKIRKILQIGKEPIIIKFKESLFQNEAFNLERELIKKIGRVNSNSGSLTNLSDGGNGPINYKHTKEAKEKISKAMKGIHPSKKNIEITIARNKTGFTKGTKRSEDFKDKLRKANLGKKLSIETKNKIGISIKNNMTDEQKRIISESNKNRITSIETRKKLGIIAKKRWEEYRNNKEIPRIKHTEETKIKIGLANKNKSKEVREKISKTHKGKIITDETKNKMRQKAKGRTRYIIFNNQKIIIYNLIKWCKVNNINYVSFFNSLNSGKKNQNYVLYTSIFYDRKYKL